MVWCKYQKGKLDMGLYFFAASIFNFYNGWVRSFASNNIYLRAVIALKPVTYGMLYIYGTSTKCGMC